MRLRRLYLLGVVWITSVSVLVAGAPIHAFAQAPATQSARVTAAADLTGTWVSVITEEWVSRMVTPRKGYVRGGGIHVTPEGMKLVNMWDPAKDEAAGEQ